MARQMVKIGEDTGEFDGMLGKVADCYEVDSSIQSLTSIIEPVLMIFVGFMVAWVADHIGTRRMWLTGAAVLQLASLLGLVLVPGPGWLWAVMLGISVGPLFPLTMMFTFTCHDECPFPFGPPPSPISRSPEESPDHAL